jgi:hypothetical protein
MGISESLKNLVKTLRERPDEKVKALSVLSRLTKSGDIKSAIIANEELCAELVKGICKKSQEAIHAHCLSVVLYLSSDTSILGSMAEVPGLVPALVGALRYTTPNSQSFAVHAIANMGLCTAKVPILFECPGLVTSIILDLKCSKDFEVTSGSASALANIFFWKECHKPLLTLQKYADLLPALVRGLSKSLDDKTRCHSARALTNLSCDFGTAFVFKSPGLLKQMVGLLSEGSERVKLQICGLLSNISASPQTHGELLKFPNLLDVVLAHLMFGDVSVQYWASRIIHNFAIEASNLPTLRPMEGLETTVRHLLKTAAQTDLQVACINLAAALVRDEERKAEELNEALKEAAETRGYVIVEREVTIGGRLIRIAVADSLVGNFIDAESTKFGNLTMRDMRTTPKETVAVGSLGTSSGGDTGAVAAKPGIDKGEESSERAASCSQADDATDAAAVARLPDPDDTACAIAAAPSQPPLPPARLSSGPKLVDLLVDSDDEKPPDLVDS